MNTFQKKRSSIREIWTLSISLYRKAFPHIWYLGIIASIGTIPALLAKIVKTTMNIDQNIVTFALYLIVIPFIAYVTSLILLKIHNIAHNEEKSWQSLLRFVNKKYTRVLVNSLIVLVMVVPGLFLLFLPGIFLLILFSMTQPLILFDNKGIINSLAESSKLVWGNWWRTCLAIFPWVFIINFIDFAAEYTAAHQSWYMLGICLLTTLLLYLILCTYLLVMFNDLKIRKNEN